MVQMPLKILIVEDSPKRQGILKNLFREHAWIMVNTAKRANTLISVYDFDIISLDYDLDERDKGDVVAEFIKRSRNAKAKVLVHSMNVQGVTNIQMHLPNSIAIPISKITRDNKTFKRFRDSINKDLDIDWGRVFKRSE
jgi:DNA-binding NtrC family response regulator